MKNEPLRLKLIRLDLKEDYTEGVLINENINQELCDTLEDRVMDANANGTFDGEEKKEYGETAIPYGTYPIDATYSPKFRQRMVAIHNVKHFEGIRLHWGRTAKNSLGCPLVGKKYDNGYLENSGMTNALVALLDKHGNKGTIEIV